MVYRIISLILLIVIAPLLVIYLVKERKSSKEPEIENIEQVENEEPPKYDPYNGYELLDLPLEYFSKEDIMWGSVIPGKTGETIVEYREVALGGKAIYQSYPTTKITIEKYSSETRPLQIKPLSDIKAEMKNQFPPDSLWIQKADDNYKEYGDLATHYFPNFHISLSDQFDVDDDDIKEKIISYNFVGRADGGSYQTDIIKGNNIIFSVNEDNSSIVPADTSNGFYVEWRSPKQWAPRCCEPGSIRTRFIFKDGNFIPLYEQEVGYMFVGSND